MHLLFRGILLTIPSWLKHCLCSVTFWGSATPARLKRIIRLLRPLSNKERDESRSMVVDDAPSKFLQQRSNQVSYMISHVVVKEDSALNEKSSSFSPDCFSQSCHGFAVSDSSHCVSVCPLSKNFTGRHPCCPRKMYPCDSR